MDTRKNLFLLYWVEMVSLGFFLSVTIKERCVKRSWRLPLVLWESESWQRQRDKQPLLLSGNNSPSSSSFLPKQSTWRLLPYITFFFKINTPKVKSNHTLSTSKTTTHQISMEIFFLPRRFHRTPSTKPASPSCSNRIVLTSRIFFPFRRALFEKQNHEEEKKKKENP